MKIKKWWSKLSRWGKKLAVISTGLLLFVLWFVYEIVTDKPPLFFPLNDVNAKYKITRDCPNGQGWEETLQSEGYAYCLEYSGDSMIWKEQSNNATFFRITIGKSKIDLEKYIGKQVKNIKGKYARSSIQCVLDKCVDIGGAWVVVNIDYLESSE